MKVIGIIPARYASTRFPGKPLVDIKGKSMICRVYEQASSCKCLHSVVVATDDQRIFDHVESFGGKVFMTSPDHKTGTDRCAEVVHRMETSGITADVAINIQGDEPFIRPEQIDQLASCFRDPEVEIATLVKKLTDADELDSPNIIKVVTDHAGRALYFSRSPIPYLRGTKPVNRLTAHTFLKHIGIYAYKTAILKKLTLLPQSELETAESLEQLRWLQNGFRIHTQVTEFESHSVDIPDDLLKFI